MGHGSISELGRCPAFGIAGDAFSHFQTLPYATLLPRYGQTPVWSVVRDGGEVIATWLFFWTPADYLHPPKSSLRRKLDRHLHAIHSPVIRSGLSQVDLSRTRELLLRAITTLSAKTAPVSIRVVLDPLMDETERREWEVAASAAGLRATPSYTYAISLPETPEALMQGMRSERRTKVRKSLRAGGTFQEVMTIDELREYYEVRLSTTSYNELPQVPWAYFLDTFEHLHPLGMYRLFLARFGDRVGAGQAAFLWNRYVFLAGVSVATWARNERVPANEFLQWEMLSWAQGNGFEVVDFAGAQPDSSDPKLHAIDTFKASWGTSLHQTIQFGLGAPTFRRSARRVLNRVGRVLLD